MNKLDLTQKELDALNSFIVKYIDENNPEEFENDLRDAFAKIIILHVKSLMDLITT